MGEYDYGEGDGSNKPLFTEKDLLALEDERLAMNETEGEMAQRMFRQELIGAAFSICHLSKYAVNERLRYDAAKYVVERNLGRLQDNNSLQDSDPFEQLMANCVISVEESEAMEFAAQMLAKNSASPSEQENTKKEGDSDA